MRHANVLTTGANMKKKVIVGISISIIVVLIAISSFVCLHQDTQKNVSNELRQQTYAELVDREGEYDPQSIVLENTTQQKAQSLADKFNATMRINEQGNYATITLPEGITIKDVYSNEENNEIISELSPDYSARIFEEEKYIRPTKAPNYTVSDTNYSLQNYINYVNIGEAWQCSRGSGVTVAVIDTGIDFTHSEFAGRISEYSYNASQDKIVKDYSTFEGDYDWSLIEDEQGHGTAVAGTIAASMDGVGTVGIAPLVNLIVIKAECDANGSFYRTSDLVFGLYYAIERDVDVVNMSFGSRGSSDNPFSAATKLGVDSDVIMIAAAGNDGTATLSYPAADENVIGVGALAENSWELASYSNYGENVDMVAPGTVYTSLIGGNYGVITGTSFASPIVTGAIALLKNDSGYKYATNEKIIEVLYASCYDLGDLGCDWYYGYGVLDINALICENKGTVTFNMLTDELENTTQIFIRNHTLQNMPEPERLYAIFDGWYYDIQCTEEYNLYSDTFTNNLTLYAKWVNEDDGVPYTYVTLDDGTLEIRSYTGRRKYITIPEKIEDKAVSSIGDRAFYGQTGLRQVNLPNTLKKIGREAFGGCSNLTAISIPQNVVSIDEAAFINCVRLSSVSIPIDGNLASIGSEVFRNCSSLRSIDLPNKLGDINGSAFIGATSLQNINVGVNNAKFLTMDGVLFNKTKSNLIAYPAGKNASYTIPEVTRTIGAYAFAYAKLASIDLNNAITVGDYSFIYSSLTAVNIKDSVANLGVYAFAFCENLSEVNIGGGITTISDSAFYSDRGITSVSIPSNIRMIAPNAFSCCVNLSILDFSQSSSLVSIGYNAFKKCAIQELEFPNALFQIGESAFADNYRLSRVCFAENGSLNAIYGKAFQNAVSLQTVVFPNSLVSIGQYAFQNSALAGEILLSENITMLGEGAFASCHNLTAIKINENNEVYIDYNGVVYSKEGNLLLEYPAGKIATEYTVRDGVEKIGSAAFYGSENLTSLIIPEGLTVISDYAFFGCRNITRYSLPSTLTEISTYSFAENGALRNISIPDEVVKIGQYAFAGDKQLQSISFSSENSKLARIGFAAFAMSGIKSFIIPSNVSTIAQYAFADCNSLNSIIFAANSKIESLAAYQFLGCNNLSSIIFRSGSKLTYIQAHALEGMTKLSSVDFGDAQLINIDNYAFRYCESLVSLNLPSTLVNIGRFAFYNCKNLEYLNLPLSVEHIGSYAFHGTKDCNLYFQSSVLPLYLDENWDNGISGYYTGVSDIITDGDWQYAILGNGTVGIISYNGTDKNIDLTTVDFGAPISNIGGYAFAEKDLESITLPDSVIQIQRYAFAYNRNLRNIVIPQNTNYIAAYAFVSTGIESLTFAGNNVKVIEQYAFSNTKNLQSVTIPASVETLGSYAFYYSGLSTLNFAQNSNLTEIPKGAFAKTSLQSVTIPDSVTLVNSSAFRENMNLTSVSLGGGDNLRIMDNAFYMTGLTSLNIPSNVEYIGEYAFVGLTGLSAITVDADNKYYSAIDGVLYSKDGAKLIAFPAGRTGNFTVPKNVETIGFGAFENSSLSAVYFEKGINLLTLGYRAFYNAKNISSIVIPASVVSIDYFAFAQCQNLTTVTFESNDKLMGIYEGAFYSCQNLRNIVLPSSVVEISDYAFYGCMSLKSLPFGTDNEIKRFSDYSFAHSGIDNLVLPSGVTEIGNYAFQGLPITELTVPDDNKYELIIGLGAFADCNNLEKITLPFIGASFEDMNITWFGYVFGAGGSSANQTYIPVSLKTVTITDGIVFIGGYAFDGVTSIDNLILPDSVDTLYYGAFNNSNVKYVIKKAIKIDNSNVSSYYYHPATLYSATIGSGIYGAIVLADVEKIGYRAFYNSSGLTSITIPNSVTSIGDYAFYRCSGLTSITIPDSVTSIGRGAFASCSSLTSITIPDSVTSIGDYAFYECTGLTEITIPSEVTSIDSSTFENCSSLKKTFFAEDSQLTSIGKKAFIGCSSLKSIEIPSGVTIIGESAFFGLSLEKLIFKSTDKLPTFMDGAFGSAQVKELFIADINLLLNMSQGKFPFGNIAETRRMLYEDGELVTEIIIPNEVTEIADYAFYQCSSIKRVYIPNSVISIGRDAFWGCDNIIDILFEDNSSLTSIGDSAFSDCSRLTSVTIPDSVTSIGDSAFSGCNSLFAVTNNSNLAIGFDEDNTGIAKYAKVIINADGTKIYKNQDVDYVETLDGYVFEYDQGQYTLVAYTGQKENITLPVNINGSNYSICNFRGTMKSIEIPDGVTSIGDSAFRGCRGLTSVTIPNSVTSIGSYAFYNCSGLTSITIPDSVTSIGYQAFYNCRGLTSVTIPDSVTRIYGSAFEGCSGLTSITIPDSVTSIGSSAFFYCSGLTSVTIGNGVTSIGDSAFSYCRGLTSVTIGNGVTSIGGSAFFECSIETIELNGNENFVWENGILYTNNYERIIYLSNRISMITLPTTIKSIPNMFLENNTVITNIIIPDSVTSIGYNAFYGCSGLTSVTIPDSVTSIGYNAFYKCSSLTSITIPDSVTSIGSGAFRGCSGLTSMTIPDSVTSIAGYAFSDCSRLTSVTIPDSVTSIGSSAFYRCSGLTSITIPDSVTSIGSSAFEGCSGLTSVTIPDSVTSIGSSAFYRCSGLENVVVSAGNTKYLSAGNCIIETASKTLRFGCKNSVIPTDGSVTSIGDYAFRGCSGLTSMTIPDSVTSIGDYAFSSCSGLTSITIPDSVTSIGNSAFSGCNSLFAVTNNSNLSIGFEADNTGIADCAKVIINADGTRIYKNQDIDYVETLDGYVFEYDQGQYTLVMYIGQKENITLPVNINGSNYSICNFRGTMKSIEIPDGVTSIGDSAFRGCSGLTEITIPGSVTSIGKSAFDGCSFLTSITLPFVGATLNGTENTHFGYIFGASSYASNSSYVPTSLKTVLITGGTSIGNYAFYGCSGLTSITIPDSVTSIGGWAFYECSGLTSITIPDSVTRIYGSAFRGCSGLTSVTIPDSVTRIYGSAFEGCSGLTSITIPDSVTSIDMDAFYECSGLTSVTIGNGVTSIGNRAFGGTALYNNENNWINGLLIVDGWLIGIKPGVQFIENLIELKGVASDVYVNNYDIKQAVALDNNTLRSLNGSTNIETLVLGAIPTFSIYGYWGAIDEVPLTLKNIVLLSGCDVVRSNLFSNIKGVKIFVEDNKEDCPWDREYKGWNNGNKVFYGDEWTKATFRDANRNIIAIDYYALGEVVKLPYVGTIYEGDISYNFVGWDVDGDEVADSLPATLMHDIDAKAVFVSSDARYKVEFIDKDGVTVLSSYNSAYNQSVVLPQTPSKHGYTFIRWVGYEEDMLVTKNIRFYSEWVHDGDGHVYTEATVLPTCTEQGYTLHICDICGESYITDITSPLGHTYGEWSIDGNPTCTTDGTRHRECACGEVETQTITMTGHNFVGTIIKHATCTVNGKIKYTCSECGDSYEEETQPIEHNYIKKTVKLSWLQKLIRFIGRIFFGYEGDNAYYYECSVCGDYLLEDSRIMSSAASVQSGCSHEEGDWCNAMAATCEENGTAVIKCKHCNQVLRAKTIEALGHNYSDEWTIDTEATCTENGSKSHHCTRCDSKTDETVIYAIGHDIVHHSAKDPTCTEKGWDEYVTCTHCDYTTYVEKPALGHIEIRHSAKDPTCTEIGWDEYITCSRCDYTTYVEKSALGHNYSEEWTIDEEAMCIENGSKSHHCSRCDSKIDETVINALGHNYSEDWTIDTEATCTENGSKSHHCTRCDSIKDATEIHKLGHSLIFVEAKEATEADEGNIEHYKCNRCDKFFVDDMGEEEIVDKDSVRIPKKLPKEIMKSDSGVKIEISNNVDAGFSSDIDLKVEVKTDTKVNKPGNSLLNGIIAKNEQISVVYEIKLVRNLNGVETEIQPSDIAEGSVITVTIAIPNNLKGKNLRILHIHSESEIEEVSYEKIGDSVKININKLSEFVFVTETVAPANNNGPKISTIVIIAIVCVAVIGISIATVVFIRRRRK